MRARSRFLRDFEGGAHLDIFLVAAITAVLAIRVFLRLTNYPQMGGGALHIAHVLWGGLLMLAGVVTLLSWRGRMTRQLGALLAGLGFGAFIDEVGKFVTADTDYFYRPAVLVIYIVFVLIYLAVRSIHRERLASSDEYLVNALAELEEVAVGDLDLEERDRALHYLERSDPADPMVRHLRELLIRADLVHDSHAEWLPRLRDSVLAGYRRLASQPVFPKAIVGFFVAQLLLRFGYVMAMIFVVHLHGAADAPLKERVVDRLSSLTLSEWGQLSSSILSGVLVALGVLRIRWSRLDAYRWFLRSTLVSIFLTQLFVFYRQQFAALAGLAFNILVFGALRFMIEREKARIRTLPRGAAPGATAVSA